MSKKPYEAPAIIDEGDVKEIEELFGIKDNPCDPNKAPDTKDKNKREG